MTFCFSFSPGNWKPSSGFQSPWRRWHSSHLPMKVMWTKPCVCFKCPLLMQPCLAACQVRCRGGRGGRGGCCIYPHSKGNKLSLVLPLIQGDVSMLFLDFFRSRRFHSTARYRGNQADRETGQETFCHWHPGKTRHKLLW